MTNGVTHSLVINKVQIVVDFAFDACHELWYQYDVGLFIGSLLFFNHRLCCTVDFAAIWLLHFSYYLINLIIVFSK